MEIHVEHRGKQGLFAHQGLGVETPFERVRIGAVPQLGSFGDRMLEVLQEIGQGS